MICHFDAKTDLSLSCTSPVYLRFWLIGVKQEAVLEGCHVLSCGPMVNEDPVYIYVYNVEYSFIVRQGQAVKQLVIDETQPFGV